ncbi:MAG: hypothetical protein JXR76_25680 [Deltaproteobacteria bacterium]|nr:hypothetical protein [Deltaproteobacteria bacterium]
MVNRREIKGIAAGIVGKFSSRNNDIGGYWALGVLYRDAVRNGSTVVQLNLLTGDIQPPIRNAGPLISYFREYLFFRLKAVGFEEYQIKGATVELKFGLKENPNESVLRKDTWGEPYLCRVFLVDDLGKCRSFEKSGWCAQHNSKLERQSARAYEGWRQKIQQ